MQSVFEKLLDNLVIAALVPSLMFFTVLSFLFGDMIPPDIVEKFRLIFGTRAVMIIIMAICTSFVLSYLSETIYWFYRGEFLPKGINHPEKGRAKKLQGDIETLTKKINELIQVDNSDPALIEAIENKKELVERYQYTFPPMEGILLIFRLFFLNHYQILAQRVGYRSRLECPKPLGCGVAGARVV